MHFALTAIPHAFSTKTVQVHPYQYYLNFFLLKLSFYLFICENCGVLPGPLVQYRNLVDQGKLQHDPYQESVASELENLLARLEKYERDMEEYNVRNWNWMLFYLMCSSFVVCGCLLGLWILKLVWQVNLSNWEKNRENERRRLLMEEVEVQQKEEDWWKRLNDKITERWASR